MDVNRFFRDLKGRHPIQMNANLYGWVLRTTLLENYMSSILRKFNIREIMDGMGTNGKTPRVPLPPPGRRKEKREKEDIKR